DDGREEEDSRSQRREDVRPRGAGRTGDHDSGRTGGRARSGGIGMTAQLLGTDVHSAVTAALSTVRDPELDESIVDLGFVTETSVIDGHAHVRLRLPTYFCAPNFAYLMVADAHDAVSGVPDVESASIVLEDHSASTEI